MVASWLDIRALATVIGHPSIVEGLHVLRRRRSPRHPRPRAARGEPVPRALAAVGLAARVRRAGDRAGAGRGAAHRRGASVPLAARLFPAGWRPQGADRLRRRSHPRRQELHDAARRGDPARARDLHHGGLVPPRRAGLHAPGQDARRAEARRVAERGRDQGEVHGRHARTGTPLLRARATDRAAAGRVFTLPRCEVGGSALPRVDPRDRQAARRSRNPPMRARLRVGHDAARLRADPAWAHRVREEHHGGEPRSRALVPPSVPRRRVAVVRAGFAQPVGRARLFPRPHLHARRHARRIGRTGGPSARAAA